MRPPVWYAQRTRPVAESTAKSRPSCEPKYAEPVDDDGRGLDLARRAHLPELSPDSVASAVTVPSCEATRMRGPSIAGLEGSVPADASRPADLPGLGVERERRPARSR